MRLMWFDAITSIAVCSESSSPQLTTGPLSPSEHSDYVTGQSFTIDGGLEMNWGQGA
jgi:hypothetical protein